MKAVSGLVLVRETGAGVPNLVVAAYDCERTMADDAGGLSLQTVLQLGRRIGSVLTNQEGRFVLTSEELEFQGNESRPDLLIVIFAPEDVQGPEEPYPLPPERRVLYVSAVPRVDAGADEAFVIRLLQEQLDKFHLSSSSSAGHGVYDSERLARAIEGGLSLREAVQARLRPRVQREHDKNLRFRKLAQDKVQDLSGIPLHLRDDSLRNNQFLIKDRRALAETLRRKQDEAIAEGLERMAANPPTLRLSLTSQDLADLDLREEDGELVGELDPLKMADKVRSLMNGVDLVRVRGLDNPPPDELERRYLNGQPAASGPENPEVRS
jgi:hypothetical protein